MSKQYLGPETRKALQNFQITKQPVSLRLIKALAHVKAACALANVKAKVLPQEIGRAISAVCDEILAGEHDSSFVTDSIQGGAGTSINMNINELIALRASELLDGQIVHPLDHANLGQSTNDTIPTALKLALIWQSDEYSEQLSKLQDTLRKKSDEFAKILKVGRTHLQDAVPITLGQEFGAWAELIKRDRQRIELVRDGLLTTNLGATAIGTSIGADQAYLKLVNPALSKRTGLSFRAAPNLIDATQNIDPLIHLSQLLELSALSFSKIASDLRLMNSGPRAGLAEINLPTLQKGSSIMAGKVNPVGMEAYNQIAFQVSGNAQTARLVLLSGQFELNTMLPVYAKATLESLTILTNGVAGLIPVIEKIRANQERCRELIENSMCLATCLNQALGYDRTAQLVESATNRGKTLREVVLEQKILTASQLDKLFDDYGANLCLPDQKQASKMK